MGRKFGAGAALLALVAAQPATAGAADEAGGRIGAFAGARVHVAFGGARRDPVRAGLTLAPARAMLRSDGRPSVRYGEGLEFGFAGTPRPGWSLAGRPLGMGARRNVSTAGTVAIVAGGLLLAGGIGFLILLHEAEKNSD